MAGVSHDDVEPATGRVHATSWLANPEEPQHADGGAFVAGQVIGAVHTAVSTDHGRVLTQGTSEHPRPQLLEALTVASEASTDQHSIERRGCGGTSLECMANRCRGP